MTSAAGVSIIVPAWNAAPTLDETLASVAAQSAPQWEAIVVDDGSSDATAALVMAWCARDPRFRLVRQANAGVSTARNAGLAEARYGLIVFLDADDLLAPRFIERVRGHLHDNEDMDLVVTGWTFLTSDGRRGPAMYPFLGDDPFITLAGFNQIVSLGSVMIRRRALAGHPFETAIASTADWDLWLRLARAGARFGLLHEPLFTYRLSAGSMSRRDNGRVLDECMWVIARAHARDDRVALPVPRWAHGAPASVRSAAAFTALIWVSAMALGQGADAVALLRRLDEIDRPKACTPSRCAEMLHATIPQAAAMLNGDWPLIWHRLLPAITGFLRGLGRRFHLQRDFVDRTLAALLRAICAHALVQPGSQPRGGPDGAFVIGAAVELARRGAIKSLPATIDLRAGSEDEDVRMGGWTPSEALGSWTDGRQAYCLIGFDSPPENDVDVEINVVDFHVSRDHRWLDVTITANDEVRARWRFEHGNSIIGPRTVRVSSAAIARAGALVLSFEIERPRSPHELGHSTDTRRLGLMVDAISLRPAHDDPLREWLECSTDILFAPPAPTVMRAQILDQREAMRRAATQRMTEFIDTQRRLDLRGERANRVSIIIITHNVAALTYECLAALAAQTPRDWETIVIDNASTDGSDALFARVDGICLVRQAENIGFVRAANIGARMASGRHLLFLNNDAVTAPGAIDHASALLDADPRLGAVGGRVWLPNGALQEAGSQLDANGAATGFGRGRDPRDHRVMALRDVAFVSGCFLMTPRDLFLELGGFDEALAPAYYEDADYCLRLWRAGRAVICDPAVNVMHYEGASAPHEASRTQMLANRGAFSRAHGDIIAHAEGAGVLAHLRALAGRSPRTRVLVLDDRVPRPANGSGDPRGHAMLRALDALGAEIVFRPANNEVLDWRAIRAAVPQRVTVVVGPDRPDLAALLDEAGPFDAIIASRPNNFAALTRVLKAAPELRRGAKLIYDAEAIYALRYAANQEALDVELDLAREADAVLCVSDVEAAHFRARAAPVSILGHATVARDATPDFSARRDFLFVGRLNEDGAPNVDALTWFVRDIWPSIAGGEPEARLLVAGLNGARSLASLAGPTFLGQIPDLTPAYDAARVFIAPTRSAAGIPIKVIEAAANGIPVVATPLLARQLGWGETELSIAGDAAEFAAACLALYRDPDRWRRQAEAARARVGREHSAATFRAALAKALDLA